LVIPAGNGAASVRITAQDDSTDEVNESVLVDIVSATVAGGTATEFTGVVGGVNETSQQEIVTITDNDATAPGASTPNVSIFVSSPTFTEAAGTIDVTLSLSVPALPGGMTVMLDYSTIVGGVPPTATKGVDYTVAVGPSGNTAGTTIKEFNGTAGSAQQQIFIPAGAQQAVLRLTAVDDTLSEINEAITVAIVAPGGATQGVAGGGQAGAAGISSTITDNDGNGTPSVSLSFINPTTGIITEAGATATTLVATLSSVSNVPVTVTLDMPAARANAVAGDIVVAPGVSRDSNGTATGATAFGAAPAPANFPTIGTPGSIVIPAGSISASLIINAVDGAADDEVTETFATDITNVTNGTELGNQSVTATIIDNDPPVATPTVAMTINAPSLTSIDETGVGAGATTTVTLTLGGAAGGPAGNLTTVLLTFGGGATLGTDYITNLAVPNQISFPAAAAIGSTVTFTITSLADNQDEPNEAVVVDIVEVANGTEALTPGQQQVTATIVDDDATVVPNVSIAGTPATIAEAAGSATITATLSATTSVNVTVPITFSGSATNGTDFTPSAATITIPAGSTTGSITVTALQDALDEIDEAIIATMGAVTGATATGGAVTTTITDDDPLANPTVTLTTSASSIAEAAGTATLTATLSTIASVPVTVNLAYTGTATNGTDYATGPTSIVVPAGSLTGTAVLTATQDTKDEPDETIIATVSSVTGTGTATAQSVTVTITDDDLQAQPNVTLSASPAALSEATVGTTSTITATLSEASSVDITVAIAFTGTATITSDFTASGSSIVIPAGSTTGTITLTAVNDPADEADSETIIATISSLTGTTGTGTGQNTTVTIADDDATVVPNVTLSATPLTIDEAGGKSTVTATLSATTSVPVTVNLAYTGTATNVTDYTRSTAQIVVAPGTTTGTAVITAVQDATDEPDETVIVDIDTVPGGNEATPQTVTVTITDDDVNLPPVAADTTAKVNAGASVTVTPTATDGNAGDVLVFSIATQGTKGTAVLNVDGTITYTANAGTTGTDTVTFSVTDGALSDTGDIVITINAIPTAADQTVAVNAGETVIGVLGGSDTEAGALTFNAVGTVAGLIVGSGGAFSYTAADNGPDQVTFQFTVTDAQGAVSAPGTVTVNVDNNDPPTTTGSTGAVTAGTAFNGTLSATDPDGDALTFIIVNQPLNGTVTQGANGAFTYNATSTTAVGDTFSFKVSDGQEDSNTSNVVLTINQKPTANSQTVSTSFGTAVTGNLTGSDANGTTLTFAASGTAVGGTVSVNSNGSFTFTPSAGFTGAGSFAFTASDGTLTSAPATVTVNVNAKFLVNTKDSASAKAGKTLVIDNAAALTNVVGADFSAASITISGSLTGDALSAKRPKGFKSKDVTISGGKDGASLTITFKNGTGTQAAVDAVLKSVSLKTKKSGSLNTRSINFTVNAGGESHSDTTEVSVSK
jgi:hypothetical protein